MQRLWSLLTLSQLGAVLLAGCGRPSGAPQGPLPAERPVEEQIPEADALDVRDDPGLRLVLADVRRLRIVEDAREPRRGVLELTLGPGFSRSSSVEYNLQRLYLAYRRTRPELETPPVMELIQDGSKVGEYTNEGLVLTEPDAAAPLAANPPPAPEPAEESGEAQPRPSRFYLSLGVGGGSADFSCDWCDFSMSPALSGFALIGGRVSDEVVLGIEGTGWTKSNDTGNGRLYSLTATALGYFGEYSPIFFSLGAGLVGQRQRTDNGTLTSSGFGISSRVGYELRFGRRFALVPFMGFVTTLGKADLKVDGESTGFRTGFNNLQYGVAFSLR